MLNENRRGRLMATVAIASRSARQQPSGATVAGLAKQSPARKVTAIVQFKPGFSERKAKTLVAAHGGKVTSRVPLIHGLAVRAPGQAGREARRASARSSASRSTRACTAPRSRTARSPPRFPKTINADKVWRRGYTGKGVGVAVIDTGIAGDAVDFKDAAGNSRVIANAVTAKGATTAGDGFGHGTHVAGIIAGNSLNRPRGRPAARQVHRRRAGREPDRGQGLRRGRQLDRPGRHQRHPVRRRPQGRVQHPRR